MSTSTIIDLSDQVFYPLVQPMANHIEDLLAVEIEHLTKRYGRVTAVDDLSLNIPVGRLFGFLGPNGAGKSTTIGCLTGLLEPTAGRIGLLGEPFTSNSVELKRHIGVMPAALVWFVAF